MTLRALALAPAKPHVARYRRIRNPSCEWLVISPESDGRWRLREHAGTVGRFDDFDDAVRALRDHLIERNK